MCPCPFRPMYQELLTVLNGNPVYVFWSGEGEEESITKSWAKLYLAPLFEAAKLASNGYMKSHRLRDTFAVDLLEKASPLRKYLSCSATKASRPRKSTIRNG